MPSFSEFSTTPASNASAGAINIAENCPAANINDALRYSFSCGRALYDTVGGIDLTLYLPKAGGTVTGSIIRAGAGVYPYWASSSLIGGAMYVQASTTPLPTSPAEGTIVYQY